MKYIHIPQAVFALVSGSVLVAGADPVESVSGTLLEEPSGIPVYETIYVLEAGEAGGEANIQVQINEYVEHITASMFIHAGETAFSLSWLNNTFYYDGYTWYEAADQTGKSVKVEADSWNQIEWDVDNLSHEATFSVDGKTLSSIKDQLPTWSPELDLGTINIQTAATEGRRIQF